MTSNFDLNSEEQKAANAKKREHERLKKQKQRVRLAEQEAVNTILVMNGENYPAAQQAIWQRNKSKLTAQELTQFEARQFEFGGLLLDVTEVIRDLPAGRTIDPANGGLPFVDTLYDTCVSGGFATANDGTRLVFHLMGEEFADLYKDINSVVYKHFTEHIDREWYLYGYYTRFLTTTWNEFVDVVARYIETHPDDDNLEKEICDKIIAEYQNRQPRRPVATTLNQSESYQVQKEITDAQNNNFSFPPSYEF